MSLDSPPPGRAGLGLDDLGEGGLDLSAFKPRPTSQAPERAAVAALSEAARFPSRAPAAPPAPGGEGSPEPADRQPRAEAGVPQLQARRGAEAVAAARAAASATAAKAKAPVAGAELLVPPRRERPRSSRLFQFNVRLKRETLEAIIRIADEADLPYADVVEYAVTVLERERAAGAAE